ncbi:MAG: MFS transporter [Streptosporangiaceae bacterium]|nr:MFS transporter [Streptosporangiaceae bacterium]MBV9855694.1 MFS transporter [Streptosporangiaceae bacterium]
MDSLGDGLFVPFAIVYFLRTTSLHLQMIGFGLTLAGLLALPAAGVAGVLTDRFTPAAVVITGNLVSAIAFAGYLVVASAWQLVAFALFAAAGNRFFWTANLALVGDAFPAAERPRWFAFQRAVRNAGFGLGGLLGAAAIGIRGGYHLLAAVNAASYVLAAALVFCWRRGAGARRARSHEESRRTGAAGETGRHNRAGGLGGFGAALRDLPFLLLAATNFLFVICMVSLDVLLTVYLVRGLHEPAWLSGVLFATNTTLVAVAQTTVSRALGWLRPARMLQLAAVVWAASFLLLWGVGVVPRAAVIPGAFGAVAVFTAAELIQGPTLNTLVVAAAPTAVRGRYLAVYQLSWALGQAAAPGVLSWLYGMGTAWPWAVLAAVCGGCVLILGRLAGTPTGATPGAGPPGTGPAGAGSPSDLSRHDGNPSRLLPARWKFEPVAGRSGAGDGRGTAEGEAHAAERGACG